MIIVKLTILSIVFTAVFTWVSIILVKSQDPMTQLKIALDNGPTWYNRMSIFLGSWMILDVIGVLASVVYLLFFI